MALFAQLGFSIGYLFILEFIYIIASLNVIRIHLENR
jgi:hypothetical protein